VRFLEEDQDGFGLHVGMMDVHAGLDA
jgi:hypothetical protein